MVYPTLQRSRMGLNWVLLPLPWVRALVGNGVRERRGRMETDRAQWRRKSKGNEGARDGKGARGKVVLIEKRRRERKKRGGGKRIE